MKNTKKIKLLSALSATIAATSLVATSCAAVAKNNNSNANAIQIDINDIPWVQMKEYYVSYEIDSYNQVIIEQELT